MSVLIKDLNKSEPNNGSVLWLQDGVFGNALRMTELDSHTVYADVKLIFCHNSNVEIINVNGEFRILGGVIVRNGELDGL